MKLTFTYRGQEFTKDQIKVLWEVNPDFTARLRVYREGGFWDYVKDVPEVLRLLDLPRD